MITIEKIKCNKCGKTLLYAEHIEGEIKCPRCKEINRIKIERKGKSQ
nr:MAG TPA: DNA-directed RNA polymerase [Caudoviricetes sp.]